MALSVTRTDSENPAYLYQAPFSNRVSYVRHPFVEASRLPNLPRESLALSRVFVRPADLTINVMFVGPITTLLTISF